MNLYSYEKKSQNFIRIKLQLCKILCRHKQNNIKDNIQSPDEIKAMITHHTCSRCANAAFWSRCRQNSCHSGMNRKKTKLISELFHM